MTEASSSRHPNTLSPPFGHKVFDLTLVIILSPLWIALILLISIANAARYGPPILYASTRIGKGGAEFTLWKFRTLCLTGEPLGRLASLLRKTHLDELPQLWNVLTGSMVLVGPRPLVPADHLSLAISRERESLMPGITGPWQLNRSHKHDYSDMEKLDSQLMSDTSIWFRVKILFRTVWFVLRALR